MRIWIPLMLVACSPHESRLDPVLRADQPAPVFVRTPEPEPDERDRELERKLRELSTRPVRGSGDKGVSLAEALGSKPGPFGPLAVLKPNMTRAEVLAALPDAQQDGAMVWAATGIDDVAVEIFFDELGRLGEIIYYVPLAARPTIVTAWGAPNPYDVWLEPERRWRARLGEDAISGKIELGVVAFTPFSEIVGRGPDGLAQTRPLIGRTLDDVKQGGTALLAGEATKIAHAVMPAATDVCGNATHLLLHLDRAGKVASLELLQCYDEDDAQRRAVLATLEQAWGKATPTRTPDDRLVFGWFLPGRRVEARPAQTGHDDVRVWRIAIAAR